MKSTHKELYLRKFKLDTMIKSTANQIARIENKFLFNACYNLTAREQKVILYLISQINPNNKEFESQQIPVTELKKILKASYGTFYAEMAYFRDTISSKAIKFTTEIEIGGKPFEGIVNWFGFIGPVINEDGKKAIEFEFSARLKPFLLDLKKYVRISIDEVVKMKSGFAIRLFQILKAHREKMKGHQKKSELKYTIEELKKLLGIEGKYKDFRNFKKKVLEPIESEINLHSSIRIEIQVLKTGRKATGIKFIITDSRSKKFLNAPTLLDINQLSRSQAFAHKKLESYGIESGIILNKILPKVKGSEFKGFEDWYFETAIKIFESKSRAKTKKAKAGTFVKWFLDSFSEDQFSVIQESIQQRKKKLQSENQEAWDNRLEAREMTKEEFEASYQK